MAKKSALSAPNGLNISVDTTTTTTGTTTKDGLNTASDQATTLASDPLPTVKVNNANLAEIKSALDDVVKKHLTSQSFTPSLLHPTVNLSLGYASIAFAAYSTLHSYYHKEFEASKPGLWIGVIGYFSLQCALWAWKRWVERGEVYRGRRRRMVKRIETDHVQITTSTTLTSPPQPSITHSPHSRPSSPILPPPSSPKSAMGHPSSATTPTSKPLTSISKSTTISAPGLTNTNGTGATGTGTGPSYIVNLTLSTTSNNGKSLLTKSRVVSGRSVGEFIDEDGGVEEGQVERWLAGLLGEAGLVGVEEEGAKEE